MISVIVPVYNVGEYLARCVESILDQSFLDFELLLIDDGSTDDSLEICRSYASLDNRILVISKENEGVSVTRNLGISKANGEWITFIDSDDWVERDYLKTLNDRLRYNNKADWVTSGLIFRYKNGNDSVEKPEVTGCFDTHLQDEFFKIVTQRLVTSPVCKLYRKSLIEDNKILFKAGLSYGEDRDFNLRYACCCNFVEITDYVGYNYQKDIPSSLTGRPLDTMLAIDLQYWNDLKKIFASHGLSNEEYGAYLANRLFFMLNDVAATGHLSETQLKAVDDLTDWKFLRNNIRYVKAGRLLKYLISNKKIKTATLLYSALKR